MCLEIQLLVRRLSDCTRNYVWYLSVAGKSTTPEACFAFADGSNSFLKVSSHSGGIDVYVGDGGSAELHSQEGKHTILKNIHLMNQGFPS